MSRQHATPLIVPAVGDAVALAALGPEAHGWSEAAVQALVQAHPGCLPIREIDPLFADPVPLCTEMNTGAGPIDNVMITASGLPVLVECKLWRNPQARREVVGQILDYAKELSRWTASDLQREVSRRTGRTGNAVVDLVREAGHQVDEIGFTDAVTLNLRRGRFLLLIVGDGIREGVEAIAEYLQGQAGLQFTLGLVEMPIFAMPDGARLVAPRVLARTVSVSREVIVVPEGMVLREQEAAEPEAESHLTDDDTSRRDFMLEMVAGLQLDDPDQPTPRVSPKGWLYLYMPAPASSCWVGVLDKRGARQVGVRLTSNVNTIGEAAIKLALRDWDAVKAELGGSPVLEQMSEGRFRVEELLMVSREASASERERAIVWLRERVRNYISTFRPRIRDAVEQLKDA
jgi:hypothetical protein